MSMDLIADGDDVDGYSANPGGARSAAGDVDEGRYTSSLVT